MARKKAKNTRGNRAAMRIIAILMVVIALVGMPNLIAKAMNESKASDWPTSEGRITYSSLTTTGVGKRKRSNWDYGYQFTLNGMTFHGGSRIEGTGYTGSAIESKEDLYKQYPEGTTITVRYKESDPTKSHFGPGPDWTNYAIPIAMGVALPLIAIFLWRKAARLKREEVQAAAAF
ncbi:MAG: DUF3592 domain-containing protein [Phycisphaerales bacterium JB065]